jgi:conjugal transfer pilin signal peptidase TrbI
MLPIRAAVALGSPGLGEPTRPGELWRAMAIIIPVGLAAWWAIPQVTLVMSPSIEAWAVRASPGPIAKDDYVMFLLSHPLAGPTPVNVTKHAMCMPGERISMIEKPSLMAPGAWDGWYFCEGRLLGVSKPYGRNGQRLDHWQLTLMRIPPGMVYVGSHNPNSFDSRYFGPVALRRLTRMVRVL